MNKQLSTSTRYRPHYLCPISRQPLDDCYCRVVTSRTVPYIARYCMERYRECPICPKRTCFDRVLEGDDSKAGI